MRLDSAVWSAYVQLKLSKLRHSLSRPTRRAEGHVFRLFRAHVTTFLEWVEENLSRPLAETGRRNLLESLDRLSLYMRFYESALLQEPPYALLEHAELLFGGLETEAVILLRPQNSQTFETQLELASVRSFLADISDVVSSPFWDHDELLARLRCIPNVYIVSYPKYFSDCFLFFPILGHEFGHVVWDLNHLYTTCEKEITDILGSVDLENERLEETFSRAAVIDLAANWAREFFCDRIGYHVYGETYIFALWLLLSPLPDTLNYTPFRVHQQVAHGSSFARLKSLFTEIRAQHTPDSLDRAIGEISSVLTSMMSELARVPRDDSQDSYREYPSPGRRLRELFRHTPHGNLVQISSPEFKHWRREQKELYRKYSEKLSDREYEEALRAAVSAADAVYDAASGLLPPLWSANFSHLNQLLLRLRNWIPPVEVLDAQLEPAAWREVILAGWVAFIEFAMRDELEERRWPDEWNAFVYESLDMTNIYKTFRQARAMTQERD